MSWGTYFVADSKAAVRHEIQRVVDAQQRYGHTTPGLVEAIGSVLDLFSDPQLGYVFVVESSGHIFTDGSNGSTGNVSINIKTMNRVLPPAGVGG